MGQKVLAERRPDRRSCPLQPSLAYRAANIYHGYYLGDLQCSRRSADQRMGEIRLNRESRAR